MSQQLINHSSDLTRLQTEGYDISIVGGYLLVKQVPYVTASQKIERGMLIMELTLSGDKTTKPKNHMAYWQGEAPCHHNGTRIDTIINNTNTVKLGEDLVANTMFSARADYRDYHHKATAYIGRIEGEASVLNNTATARVFPLIGNSDTHTSVFEYTDTASSRADIGVITDKLFGLKLGIIGLGGTGSYILDLVAKTPVAEIHLMDGDVFLQHNAFRAPSAPSRATLEEKPLKVNYFANIYSNMRQGIVAHPCRIDENNLHLLDGLDFVFICIDDADSKKDIVRRLDTNATSFIEVGMGAFNKNDKIGGIIRTVVRTPDNHEKADVHISYDDSNIENVYATNIQIAELNSLNATLAVIQWKKLYQVYQDIRHAYVVEFAIDSSETIIEGIR